MYIPVYVFVERSQLKCQSRIWVINMLLLGKPNGTMTLKFFSIPPLPHSILTNDNYFFKPFLDVLFSCCLGNHKNLVFRLFTFNVRTIFLRSIVIVLPALGPNHDMGFDFIENLLSVAKKLHKRFVCGSS